MLWVIMTYDFLLEEHYGLFRHFVLIQPLELIHGARVSMIGWPEHAPICFQNFGKESDSFPKKNSSNNIITKKIRRTKNRLLSRMPFRRFACLLTQTPQTIPTRWSSTNRPRHPAVHIPEAKRQPFSQVSSGAESFRELDGPDSCLGGHRLRRRL